MKSQFSNIKKPEEIELEKKFSELSDLQASLSLLELKLATLLAEIRAFNLYYLKNIGIRLARLDELKAQIAEMLAELIPQNEDYLRGSREARFIAEESRNEVDSAYINPDASIKFSPSENLKRLYREIAKKLHPDLAIEDDDRERRNKWMAEANAAYQSGDEERLIVILQEWETSPDTVEGDNLGSELIRVLRRIAQVQRRLGEIKSELTRINQMEIYQLKIKIENAEAKGQDILGEMAVQIDQQIAQEELRLTALLEKHR